MATGTRKKILFIIGLSMVCGVVFAGALGAFVFWGWGIFASQAEDALNRNLVIQEQIGEITELDLRLTATALNDAENVFVFRVTGTRATGIVTAEFVSVNEDTEEITWGILELSTGEVLFLSPKEE